MYEGEIVKVSKVHQMWLVENGERHPIADQAELMAIGLRRVNIISAQALEAIPLEGQGSRQARPKSKAAEPEPEQAE